MIDQRLHDGALARSRGPHERRLPVPRFLRVDLGAGVQESVHGINFSAPRRVHQRRLSGIDGTVWIGAGLQQLIDDGHVAILGSEHERRDAVVVRCLRTGTGAEQQCRRFRVIQIRGPVQRCRAVALGRVHVRVRFQERQYRLLVAMLHGVGERGPFDNARARARALASGAKAGNRKHQRQAANRQQRRAPQPG